MIIEGKEFIEKPFNDGSDSVFIGKPATSGDFIKQNAIEFLKRYNDSDYCLEEDGTFSYYGVEKNLTGEKLYDKLMITK